LLKLKKVHILGFKSFCDRTEIALDDTHARGLTAIVGPNGCGKSNISDALSWVLGEQSAKSMRGVKMEDVIFAGTRERRPTGMAEVSLTFIDPEIYGPEAPGATEGPEVVLRDSFAESEMEDWDEGSVRARAAQETEEAIAELQPGQVLEEEQEATASVSSPLSAADGVQDGALSDAAASAPGSPSVVLKVRRRKFQRTPARRGEIVITRRLFRSGNSEYLLNGKLCRLRDIQDIFLGTGLGPDSYAIIEQERVGQLLSSKPHDRRAIIEEAAGITRFKTKKRLAELRLEQARQNLARVNDIFDEVTRQMNSLKRQAAKAERYATLRQDLQQRLRLVVATRLATMDSESATLAEGLAALTAHVDALGASVASLDLQHAGAVAQGYALETQGREAASRASSATVELERVLTQMQANVERSAELVVRLKAAQAELEETRKHLAELAGERGQQQEFLAQAHGAVDASRQEMQARQTATQQATANLSRAEQEMEGLRRQMLQWMTQANQVRQQIMQGETSLEGLEREADRLATEHEGILGDLERLGVERGQVSLTFASATGSLQQIEAELASLRAMLEARRSEEDTARRSVDQLRAEHATLLGRRNSLEALIHGHSYSTDTVRKLLRAKSLEGSMAPVGVLADFLDVNDQYGAVVDEFLREELNYIVVKSWDAAQEGVRVLKTDVDGRATFLVHPEGAQAKFSLAPSEHPPLAVPREGVVRLKDCIQVQDGFGKSLEVLLPKLRDGYLAPDTESARTLALENPEAFFLTPTGECFHNVTVTGGKPSVEGPLALKRELREAQQGSSHAEEQLAQAETHAAELTRRVAELGQKIEAQSVARRQMELQSANAGAALRQLEAEIVRLERRLQDWRLQSERNKQAQTEKSAWLAQRREEIARMESEHANAEQQLIAAQTSLEGLRSARETAQALLAEAAAHLSGLEERRRGAAAAAERLERMHADLQQRVRQLEQQLAAGEAERVQRLQEGQRLEQRRIELEALRESASKQAAEFSGQTAQLRQQAADLEDQLRSLRAEAEAEREKRSEVATRAARLSSDLAHQEETCLQELGVAAEQLRADNSFARLEAEALAEEDGACHALKQRLESMGPVNMMALEEYKEAAQRHEFLETQRKDLLDSIDNTQNSIREIEGISRIKFEEAFARINENFSATFTRLFGGGQALMRLTDEENTAESGIDIIASPPGKKLQNVLLLSGGEKALTALSLLIGIFQYQPSPFCLLDEVDSPLDEVNVGRLATMLKGLSDTTHFIVITHSKRMMQSAESIFGVTMQEPGISKVVSVRLGSSDRGNDRRDRTGQQGGNREQDADRPSEQRELVSA
jgi:chromosome segregation protein